MISDGVERDRRAEDVYARKKEIFRQMLLPKLADAEGL
jgi:hypothetical protein